MASAVPIQVAPTLAAPLEVFVSLPCPSCEEELVVKASLFARVTRDSDGKGAIALRTRAPKVSHVCGEPTLGLVESDRVR
jgi:hypothetical protein